jgi:hypothetical protein
VSFEPLDTVLVARLLHATRDVDGGSADPPQPHVGQSAIVVDALGDDLFLVEHLTDDGRSVWIAEFHESELELLDRPERA